MALSPEQIDLRPVNRHSTVQTSSPLKSIEACFLFDIPLELFLIIWKKLPLYSRLSLTLTCRQLFASYKASVLSEINVFSAASRLQKLYFLRVLRKDLPDSRYFLCHHCLILHLDPAKSPRFGKALPHPAQQTAIQDLRRGTFHVPGGSGFPYCDSAFTLALRDVQSRVESSCDSGPVCTTRL
jgi:hypothetical protein